MRPKALLALLVPMMVTAQEHPYIAAYTLTELDGAIRIEWSIQGGTCNGQDVERSTVGTSFASVHHIEGICGGTGSPVPYAWTDPSPPEFTTVYYRVKLGIEGYTSVMSVDFDQLTTSDQRFFPSPMNGKATLVLNVPDGTPVDLSIHDANGKLMLSRSALQGSMIPILLPGVVAGTYHYRAIADGRFFTGRFVKE